MKYFKVASNAVFKILKSNQAFKCFKNLNNIVYNNTYLLTFFIFLNLIMLKSNQRSSFNSDAKYNKLDVKRLIHLGFINETSSLINQ